MFGIFRFNTSSKTAMKTALPPKPPTTRHIKDGAHPKQRDGVGSRDNSRLNNLRNIPASKSKPPKPPCNQYTGETNDAEYYANKLLEFDMLDCKAETLIAIYKSSAMIISTINELIDKHEEKPLQEWANELTTGNVPEMRRIK